MKIIYVDHNCEEPYEGVKFDDENRKEFNLWDDALQDCLEEEWDEDHVLDDQLRRYKEIIENQFPNHHQTFVFLTPEGNTSEDENQTPMNLFRTSLLSKRISIFFHSR
jgi:hypothetical protein